MSQASISPARTLPGVALDQVEASIPAQAADQQAHVVRGSALIFWDPRQPDQKLSAVDTDQITPSQDCVSESLDTLDKNWKEGAFRHLMPDFRARVHQGQNFVIAADRFAIGSSREMSPAGLKAVAEEVGLELVVVCAENMGDIFRRNAINLGLHVVQSPQAVGDAQEGDQFEFHSGTRQLTNLTQNKVYQPIPLTAKEEDIRRSGGIFQIGRQLFPDSLRGAPQLHWPDPDTSRGLTTSEQIFHAHRVDPKAQVAPGQTLALYGDMFPASDGTAPFSIYTFLQITGGDTIYPRQAAVASDHFVFTGRPADEMQTRISQQFAAKYALGKPHFADPGDGIFHLYFPEQGLIRPGGFYPGADSHSRAYGAYGAVGIGVGSTTLGFGWSTGWIYLTLAKQRRVRFAGELQPWASGKDIVLALLRRWGKEQAQGMGVEFVDLNLQLPMTFRNTIANMMAEAEAQNGIFAQDDITTAWFEQHGFELDYPRLQPGSEARYELDEEFSLSDIRPLIAKPFSPGNAFDAEEVAKERLTFDKAYIGSCTNGSYEDLLQAALVLQAAAAKVAEGVDLVVFPGSGNVKLRIEHADPRLGGASIADVLRASGAQIRDSWCGPCFGQGPDSLQPGQRAITTFNRNWQNRMGLGGEGYLASPVVVAASALLGYMAPPSELGLQWKAEHSF